MPIESGNPYLVGASPHVVDAPPDWPANIQLTGFFAWDTPRSYSPPDGLRKFFEAGRRRSSSPSAVAPPLTRGSSTLTLCEPPGGLDTARSSSAAPTPEPIRLDPSPDTYVLPFAPLSQIGPRCLAAIQHGGIGTTVGLLAAGLPQLIVPRAFDQPQTALRMSRLGVATITPWSRASGPALERALANLLSTDGYRHRASAFATWLEQERGLDNEADALEQALTLTPP